ncbi:MAG: hypothetical protein KJ063_24020 [Anaerolineae bacterium]|nr:hypothetical protein [Anaerolineae bacterium]
MLSPILLWWVVVGATNENEVAISNVCRFSTLWWVVVGATVCQRWCGYTSFAVSVPSGGSWWEQHQFLNGTQHL